MICSASFNLQIQLDLYCITRHLIVRFSSIQRNALRTFLRIFLFLLFPLFGLYRQLYSSDSGCRELKTNRPGEVTRIFVPFIYLNQLLPQSVSVVSSGIAFLSSVFRVAARNLERVIKRPVTYGQVLEREQDDKLKGLN